MNLHKANKAYFNYPLAFFSFVFYISLIAPTDPPENLTVQDSSYTWLLISWNHSRPYFSRNEVEGFLININENGGLFNNTLSVQHIPEEKNISGLKEHTEYCIKVKAVTTGGLGEESDELCAFTRIKKTVREKILATYKTSDLNHDVT